jgi:hypothetical protein
MIGPFTVVVQVDSKKLISYLLGKGEDVKIALTRLV